MSWEAIDALWPAFTSNEDRIEEFQASRERAQARPDDVRVCKQEVNEACPEGSYFNELACQCFSMSQCRKGCEPGYFLDPSQMCGECMTQAQIFDEYYPEWAEVYDVVLAQKQGGLRLWEDNGMDNSNDNMQKNMGETYEREHDYSNSQM